MKRFVLLLVALSIVWVLMVFGTGMTALITAVATPVETGIGPDTGNAGIDDDNINNNNENAVPSPVEKLDQFLDSYTLIQESAPANSIQDISYSCLMLAGALNSEGYDADIVVGRYGFNTADFTQFDMAWLIVHIDWESLVVNAREHAIVHNEAFSGYHTSYSFEDPKDFSDYVGLIQEYETILARTSDLESGFNECSAALANMSEEYDKKYGGRFASSESIAEQSRVYQKLGECKAISDMLDSERRSLSYLEQAIDNKVLSSAARM